MKARLIFGFGLLAALLVTGCEEPSITLFPAEGTVTYNGTAVNGATVTMAFDNGQLSTGTTGPDGKFTVSTGGRIGAPIGLAEVSITKFGSMIGTAESVQLKPEDMMKMQKDNSTGAPPTPTNELPEKYSRPSTSSLTADVVKGGKEKNTFTFTLVD